MFGESVRVGGGDSSGKHSWMKRLNAMNADVSQMISE